MQSSFWIPTQDHQAKPETKSTSPPAPPPQTTHQSCFPSESWLIKYTHTHKPSLSKTQKNQARYFFLSVSSSALNKSKLLRKHTKHTKQSSSSDKTSLQNTHTQNQSCLFLLKLIVTQQNESSKRHTHTHPHTEKKTKTMFLGACYYHSTKHKSLSTSNQKLQSSVIFVAHICYQPNAPKKRQCMMNTFFSSSVMICKT